MALAVMGIGILAIVGVMPHLMNASRQSIEYTEVALVAQDIIERDYRPTMTPVDLATTAYTSARADSTNTLSFNADFTYNYTLATNAFGTNGATAFAFQTGAASGNKPLLKTVQITYSWPKGAKNPQRFTFITELAARQDIPMQ